MPRIFNHFIEFYDLLNDDPGFKDKNPDLIILYNWISALDTLCCKQDKRNLSKEIKLKYYSLDKILSLDEKKYLLNKLGEDRLIFRNEESEFLVIDVKDF